MHRDLKPANIFAARRGHLHDFAKLLDFGLVLPPPEVSNAETSREGTIAGSPQYMAPEQATGDARPDARTDLYGLGAVGYFVLTGRPPFAAPTAMAMMIAVARDPVEPPSVHRPGLPADLEPSSFAAWPNLPPTATLTQTPSTATWRHVPPPPIGASTMRLAGGIPRAD